MTNMKKSVVKVIPKKTANIEVSRGQDFFQISSNVFSCAEEAVLHLHPVGFEPVRMLTRLVGSLYNALDRMDSTEAAVARVVWQLRSTVLFTLLPFDHPALPIRELGNRLVRMADTLPSVRQLAVDINGTVKQLYGIAENPKWALLNELCLQSGAGDRIGLLTALCPGPVPGWPEEFRELLATIPDRHVSAVDSRRDLKFVTFDTLIIPAGLRHCAPQLASDAVHGCRARRIHLLRYESEGVGLPERSVLPASAPFIYTVPERRQVVTKAVDIPDVFENVDQWLAQSYWVNLRPDGTHVADDQEETEAARFTVFFNGYGAFLPDEGKVIEVSELFDGLVGTAGNDLPRKRVNLLEEGDLVVIRTSGGGDYVEQLADALLRRANRSGLRASALAWKAALRSALLRHGPKKIAALLRAEGGKVTSPGYIYNWAGSVVMSPQRAEDFVALMKAVTQAGEIEHGDPVQYANKKWREMEELKSYHHRAGQQIRRELLTKVNELAAVRRKIETEARIALPHAEGSEMSVLRIAAIDRTVVDVPRSRLFRLEQTVPALHG